MSERAERQGGRDQRAIGEMRMIDFKVKMLQVQLVRFALFKKKKKKLLEFRLDSKSVSA